MWVGRFWLGIGSSDGLYDSKGVEKSFNRLSHLSFSEVIVKWPCEDCNLI